MGSEQERGNGDEGFSLLETVVALAVVSVTMLAAAPFFVNSLAYVNKQRTQQAAVQLAATAMEQVRGLKGSALLSGRSVNATQEQFDLVLKADLEKKPYLRAVKPYLASMLVAGDPMITDAASTVGADAPISTSAQQVTVEGTTFTQNIYVGKCEVYLTGTTECVYPETAGAPADSTDILRFFRVVVFETWSDSSCANSICTHVATTLVSSGSEPTFDFNRPAPKQIPGKNDQTWYVGDSVSYQMKAEGGQLPNTWTIAKLPDGLSMSPAGMITGVPTATAAAASPLSTTATVTDRLNRSNTAAVRFTVYQVPTPVLPANPVVRTGDPYSLTLTATGGKAPYTYQVSGLPAGLRFDPATAVISGNPSVVGAFTVTVVVTDGNKHVGPAKSYTLTVQPGLILDPLVDQTIDLGSKFDLTAVGSGGTPAYTYSATGLPPGVTMHPKQGFTNGNPTASGRFLPTITVTDSAGRTASQQIVIIVNTADSLVFTAPALTAPDQATVKGTAASLTLTTNGTLLGLSPTVTVTGLPPGLTYNALTGVVSGTPTTSGLYTVSATAGTLTPAHTSILTFTWRIS
ncbi:putative Ig domain-containing protein [Actinoplanes regularis]|uniref:Prepilin-type N-terminal cleavage/methylation domain-containing protein n=1 Tax=Actinoplanes regularis TaxID=52697 RepID=A0A238UTJ7_9ACTN|nr:putative Ig domain-containing protein [Actinoplanes regularis]GIE84433.1 hypothetical protein Are01nite_09130 [Actinoplanes regularis]SNR25432.1 prepilin-type N-terminal cleavage/methylation domain-containing protein [Actinoplanes regularis]